MIKSLTFIIFYFIVLSFNHYSMNSENIQPVNYENDYENNHEKDHGKDETSLKPASKLKCLFTLASALMVIGGCKPNLTSRPTTSLKNKENPPVLKKKADTPEKSKKSVQNNEKEVDILINITLRVKKMHAKYKMIKLMLPYYFDRQKYEPNNREWPKRITGSKRELLKILENIDMIVFNKPELKKHLSIFRKEVLELLKKHFDLNPL